MESFQDMFDGDVEPTIHLHFAGDERKTSKKIRTVMAVFSVLKEGIHKPDYQYNACLYNGMYTVFHLSTKNCRRKIFMPRIVNIANSPQSFLIKPVKVLATFCDCHISVSCRLATICYMLCIYGYSHFPLGKEGYEELNSCMKGVFQEMKDLERNGLSFNGRHFKIEWLVSKWLYNCCKH